MLIKLTKFEIFKIINSSLMIILIGYKTNQFNNSLAHRLMIYDLIKYLCPEFRAVYGLKISQNSL